MRDRGVKNCPFCGGPAEWNFVRLTHIKDAHVWCSICSATTDRYYTMEDALEAWNSRIEGDKGESAR